jgi:hypothetical protein
MHIGQQEWRRLEAAGNPGSLRSLYHRLADGQPDADARAEAADFLRSRIARLDPGDSDLPASPDGLLAWMENSTQDVHAR